MAVILDPSSVVQAVEFDLVWFGTLAQPDRSIGNAKLSKSQGDTLEISPCTSDKLESSIIFDSLMLEIDKNFKRAV
jgi:hypothetical protein